MAAPSLCAAALATVVGLQTAVAADPESDGAASSSEAPQRVVSVGGALTEIVYELDAQDSLVGVDTTSLHPEAATALPQVGYQRNLSAEGVLSLDPDLMLVTDDAGPPEALEQIEAAGIEIQRLPSGNTLETVLERVDALAARFDRTVEGETLAARIEAEMDEARAIAATLAPSPRAVFLLGTGTGSAMAAGGDTAADSMLRYAGAENALSDFDGYKPVGAEGLIAAAPEVIVVVAHGESDDEDVAAAALAVPGAGDTPAGRSGHVVVADALRLLGFGPRIGEAVRDLAARLRDGVDAPR